MELAPLKISVKSDNSLSILVRQAPELGPVVVFTSDGMYVDLQKNTLSSALSLKNTPLHLQY